MLELATGLLTKPNKDEEATLPEVKIFPLGARGNEGMLRVLFGKDASEDLEGSDTVGIANKDPVCIVLLSYFLENRPARRGLRFDIQGLWMGYYY